jgi:hypothetical protein
MEEGVMENPDQSTDSERIADDHPTWPAPPPDMDVDDAPTATEGP